VFTTKKPEEFGKVVDALNLKLEKQKALIEGTGLITQGTNARAANMGSQTDLNVVSAGAVASFGLQIGQGSSAVAALAELTPAIEAMRTAMAGGNFEMSAAGTRLLELGAIVEANRVPFQNLAADGQILQGMMQGNIRDFDLFRAVTSDIGVQLQGMIDKGVPTAQVFALAQPQLQAIWEAQQKWRFEVDGTTQALIDQAVQQGIVGNNMKSVQQQMLDAMIGVKDVLTIIAQSMGALPSVAQRAADGMNDAFGRVRGPRIEVDGITPSGEPPEVPQLARGGIVHARPGGTLVNVGEGGEDEVVAPMSKLGGITVNVHAGTLVHQDDLGEYVANAAAEAIRLNRGGSFQRMTAALGRA
jgi:hypothetical protein